MIRSKMQSENLLIRKITCNNNDNDVTWYIQCESKKVAPPKKKLFAIFSLRLSIFPRNFARILPAYIYTYLPVLVDLS